MVVFLKCLFAAVVLSAVFLPGLAFHLGINSSALRVGSEWTTEKKDVRFGTVGTQKIRRDERRKAIRSDFVSNGRIHFLKQKPDCTGICSAGTNKDQLDSTGLTDEWHNVAILDSAEHRCRATPIPTGDGSWAESSRAPLVE